MTNHSCPLAVAACRALLLLSLMLTACEKAITPAQTSADPSAPGGGVTLRFSLYEQEDFTRAPTSVTELCSRLNIVVFSTDGSKLKSVAQKDTDANFGTVVLSLAEGAYSLVVIAHSCDGSATITSEEKVTFPNNKVTDTFYYYGSLDVTAEPQTRDLTLRRAVAMFRMVMTDQSLPDQVSKFKFYYLGGSSTFSPAAGYGCVQSKQTEVRPVSAEGVYDIYTMPHSETDELTKLTITALDAGDNIIGERVLENIPVTRNKITRYSDSFFGDSPGSRNGGGDLRLLAEPEWSGVSDYQP